MTFDLNTAVSAISAIAALLTALSLILKVLPKLGIHDAKLDGISKGIESLASAADDGASELAKVQVPGPAPPAQTTPKPISV